MKLNLAIIMLLALAAPVLAEDSSVDWDNTDTSYYGTGQFGCDDNSVPDASCAQTCCAQNGGEYSVADDACLYDSTSAWEAVQVCVDDSCCGGSTRDANYYPADDFASSGSDGGGCCAGPAFLLVGMGMFAGAGAYLNTKRAF